MQLFNLVTDIVFQEKDFWSQKLQDLGQSDQANLTQSISIAETTEMIESDELALSFKLMISSMELVLSSQTPMTSSIELVL